MSEKNLVSIIIVNYNVRDFLMHALESIQRALQDISAEIFVVDNASVDGSVEMLKNTFPEVLIIENKSNVGFAAANNLAIQKSSGEYIVLINPDTVVQEDTFTSLISFMSDHPDAGAATCKILNPNGSFSIDSRHSIPTPMTAFWKQIGLSKLFPKSKTFARYNLTYLDENEINQVDAISGSFMFIRRAAYEDVGLLDEDYFMYCEDVDYCYRITQSGWKIYYVPDSSLIHYKGESTKKNNIDYVINFNRSLYLFYKKHFHQKYFALVGWLILLGVFLRGTFIYIKNSIISNFSFLLDIFLINLVILLTFIVRFEFKSGFSFDEFFNHYIIINLLATMIFSIAAFSLDLYKTYRFSLVKIFKTNFATFFILSALTFFMKQFGFSRMVVVIAAFFSTLVMMVWRLMVRRYWRGAGSTLGRDILKRRTVLVGTDKRTENLIEKIKQHVKTGIDLVGLVSLSTKEVGEKIKNVPIVTTVDNMKEYIRLEKVDQVIFSTHNIAYETIIKTMSMIGSSNVEYKIIPQNLEVIIGKASVERFTDYQLLDIDYAIGKPYNRILKRAFDLIGSVIVLLITLPIWSILLLIRWRSFKTFYIWGENSEKVAIKQSWKNPFSGLLNKLLLHIYIFKGRLSFVGAPFRIIKDIQPIYYYKPGLFGLLQSNESRLESNKEREQYELYYLKNQNIWLDLEIIIKSLIQGSG